MFSTTSPILSPCHTIQFVVNSLNRYFGRSQLYKESALMFLLLQYILILLHHTDCLLNDYRFSYPHGLALIRSGLLVVTDSANNRVRLVDLEANSVSTLSDGITSPMSVAYNPETTSVYVGGADGLYLSNVPSKC